MGGEVEAEVSVEVSYPFELFDDVVVCVAVGDGCFVEESSADVAVFVLGMVALVDMVEVFLVSCGDCLVGFFSC